jgi:hypothetical protein
MTPEELDSLQEELEEYLPTSLQSKLDKLFDLVRTIREQPIRKEWVENQKRILDIQNKISWNTLADYPQKTTKKPQKNHKKTTQKPQKN